MADNQKNSIIKALTWSSVNVFGIQVVQAIVGILLARLLFPEDFGEIGVLFIFIGISTVLIDGGFGQGLIRKQNVTAKDYSTIFYLNLFIAALLYLVLFLSAPAIAGFFKIPHIVITSRVLFLIVFLYSFYIIPQTQLTKNMDYKSLAVINVASVLSSGLIAIYLATSGFGVWALVAQQLLFHFFKALFYPFYSKWKPSLDFSFDTVKELWQFSISILGQSSLNVIFTNIYTVLLGAFYPIKQVGYYAQANKYSETVNSATQSILYYSTFPVFSKIQNDLPRLRNMYRKLISSLSMITFPLFLLLIIVAKPLFIFLFTDKWLPSVELFQLLLFANILSPSYYINTYLLNSQGFSKTVLILEIVKKSLILVSIFICFQFNSIQALLIGLVIANYVAYGISMFVIKSKIEHYHRHQVLDLLPALIMVLCVGALTWTINLFVHHNLLLLALQSISFIALYTAAVRIFFPVKFKEMLKLLRREENKKEI